MVSLEDWCKLPHMVYPVLVPWDHKNDAIAPDHPYTMIFDWCRDNLKEHVHFPRTSGVDVILNSDHLPRPKLDYSNPYHWTMYNNKWQKDDAHLLVLCESANDAMLLKMAWC